VTVFGNLFSDTFDDPDHSTEERRFIIIGLSEKGRILIVAHTDDGETVRIINAREPPHGERKFYEEPDVAAVFPDAKTVNEALRLLIKVAQTQASPRR